MEDSMGDLSLKRYNEFDKVQLRTYLNIAQCLPSQCTLHSTSRKWSDNWNTE